MKFKITQEYEVASHNRDAITTLRSSLSNAVRTRLLPDYYCTVLRTKPGTIPSYFFLLIVTFKSNREGALDALFSFDYPGLSDCTVTYISAQSLRSPK